ncbi:hypothetical protein pdam_00024933 [Pocillopora damicornis]|uniref:Uncharacterized protein n=1 Tax=Pocillopora damicornis TaxID=46731 RepID=A0A3M6UG67_POCDA|nr:hypothetical protein pdam_00024933 [Pocillopora damicornis]
MFVAPHVSSARCTIYVAFRSPLMKAVDRSSSIKLCLMHHICSHSLAADNHYLQCFVTLYLLENKTSNLTAASVVNGRNLVKPLRNKSKESVVLTEGETLGELLRDLPPDCSQLQYSVQSSDGNKLKVKLIHITNPRPEKPVTAVDTSEQNFDSQYCLRHKEEDYVYISKTNQWIKKIENKHYYVNRKCIIGRNPNLPAK